MRAMRVKSAAEPGRQAGGRAGSRAESRPPMRTRGLGMTWREAEASITERSSLGAWVVGSGGVHLHKWVRVMSPDNGGIYHRLRRKEAKRVALAS